MINKSCSLYLSLIRQVCGRNVMFQWKEIESEYNTKVVFRVKMFIDSVSVTHIHKVNKHIQCIPEKVERK